MEFVLELQKLMIKNNYLIAVRDNFENLLAKSVLKITDKKIREEPVEIHVKNRVFSVIVECVQNICSPNFETTIKNKKDSVLLMNKVQNGYQIFAGSRVETNQKERLEQLLFRLRNLNIGGIKELKKEVLKMDDLSADNQEKLTFIELFLRSDGNISFFFDNEESDTHFFMVQIELTNN